MDYEKKYKDAIAKAKEQYNYPCMQSSMGILEEIFPELLESEDEKYQQGWHDALEKQGEQNPAWSEEDEDMFNDVIIDLKIFRDKDPGEAGKAAYQREIDWLKSLKERIV